MKEQLMEAYKRGSRDSLDSIIKVIEDMAEDGLRAVDIVVVVKEFRKSL